MKRRTSATLAIALVFALGMILGGLYTSPPSLESAPEKPEFDSQEMEQLREFGEKFGKLFRYTAATVMPSVVWIEAEKTVELQQGGRNPLFNDPFFRRFFGPEFDERFGPQKRERKQKGLGSGFIIDEEGYILTNNHVVADADKLTVKLSNGEEYPANVSGVDPSTELAVIQIEGNFDNLPVVEMGNSDDIHVGEWVIAVGNPLGLSQTVSSGIVSAKGRSIGIAKYENLIQTDAAINPGNSGGPLVNLQGKVIGINTAIVSRTGGYMGVGLAIPVNMAKPIIEDLKAGRTVERGYLGIAGGDLSPDLARQFGYDKTEGAIVNEVLDDTPADEVGLKPGDIITSWDGKAVKNFDQLRRMVAKTKPGEKVKFTIWRDSEKKTLTVTLKKLTDEQVATESTWIGLKVGTISEEAKNYYGRNDLTGVMVREVDQDGPASMLAKGDIILGLGRRRQPVDNPETFYRYVGSVDKGESALLYVLRRQTKRAEFVIIHNQ